MATLVLDQLTKLYGGHVLAVDKLDLASGDGEIIGLLGSDFLFEHRAVIDYGALTLRLGEELGAGS